MSVKPEEIVFVSSHYPTTTYFAQQTRKSFEKYTAMHNYGYYYDTETSSTETEINALHFKRCVSLQLAASKFPDAKWFVWVDSDVFVNNYHLKVEECIDLTNENMLYHVCHEAPWGAYPINTGVKFVHRDAMKYEEEVWGLRSVVPWPYEQKTIYEHIFPKITGRYMIHDPYVLNCIIKAYPDRVKNALFVHMCASSEEERNHIISQVTI